MMYEIIGTGCNMVLTNVGDTFSIDPMLIFYRQDKEVPVSDVFPGVKDIDILENLLVDGYDVTVSYSNGSSATATVPSLGAAADYICKLAKEPTEAPTTAAEPSSDAEPTSETEPATEPTEAHKQLLPSNGTARAVLQDFSRDRVSFWVVYYDCDHPDATQVDLDKTVAHIPYTTDALDPSDINCFLQRCIDATHCGDEWFANGGEAVLARYVIDKLQAEIAHSLAQRDGEDIIACKRQVIAKYQARLDELEPHTEPTEDSNNAIQSEEQPENWVVCRHNLVSLLFNRLSNQRRMSPDTIPVADSVRCMVKGFAVGCNAAHAHEPLSDEEKIETNIQVIADKLCSILTDYEVNYIKLLDSSALKDPAFLLELATDIIQFATHPSSDADRVNISYDHEVAFPVHPELCFSNNDGEPVAVSDLLLNVNHVDVVKDELSGGYLLTIDSEEYFLCSLYSVKAYLEYLLDWENSLEST